MSWRNAPLYIEAHDIAVDVTARVAKLPDRHRVLGERMAGAALDLLEGVSIALTFPGVRPAALRRADEAIVRLRVSLRVAREHGLISPGAVRHVARRLRAAGRMLGGWRRRIDAPAPTPEAEDGQS